MPQDRQDGDPYVTAAMSKQTEHWRPRQSTRGFYLSCANSRADSCRLALDRAFTSTYGFYYRLPTAYCNVATSHLCP
jgi:hypothetical protein